MRLILVLSAALPVGLAGCTHTMRVRNLQEYVKTVPPGRALTIVVDDRSTGADEHEYFAFVREALATHPAVRSVVLAATAPADLVPDVTVAIRPHPTYHGSWWNYPITFPGFILFTHAWNGYVYRADLDTEITVNGAGRPPATRTIETRYRMRHCDFKRGALTSSGWYTPAWGGLNAIMGFYMVGYDSGATPAFRQAVRSAYGSYIANSIVEMAEGSESAEAPHHDDGTSLDLDEGFAARCG